MQTTKRSTKFATVLTALLATIGLIVPMSLQTAQGAEPQELDVSLVNEVSVQSTGGPSGNGFPTSNMFDGDVATWYHSQWAHNLELSEETPYNLDFSVGDSPKALDSFVLTPKETGTGDGALNGRISQYALYVGNDLDDADSLVLVESGTWNDLYEPREVDLAGHTAQFIRLAVMAVTVHRPTTSSQLLRWRPSAATPSWNLSRSPSLRFSCVPSAGPLRLSSWVITVRCGSRR